MKWNAWALACKRLFLRFAPFSRLLCAASAPGLSNGVIYEPASIDGAGFDGPDDMIDVSQSPITSASQKHHHDSQPWDLELGAEACEVYVEVSLL